ncbi:hypothetical protein MRX96_025758 [Rhipicephalus microplus]
MRIIVMAAQALSDIHRRQHCSELRTEARTTIAVCARLPILDSVNFRSTNPWADEGRVYQVQKQDWISTAMGHDADINMTVPLTHFLLLTQVIYCSAANAHHRNGSTSTERYTSATTLFRTED